MSDLYRRTSGGRGSEIKGFTPGILTLDRNLQSTEQTPQDNIFDGSESSNANNLINTYDMRMDHLPKRRRITSAQKRRGEKMSRSRTRLTAVHNELRDASVPQYGDKVQYDNLMMPVK